MGSRRERCMEGEGVSGGGGCWMNSLQVNYALV